MSCLENDDTCAFAGMTRIAALQKVRAIMPIFAVRNILALFAICFLRKKNASQRNLSNRGYFVKHFAANRCCYMWPREDYTANRNAPWLWHAQDRERLNDKLFSWPSAVDFGFLDVRD